MKAYVCDACKKTIKNPHDVKMKEYYFKPVTGRLKTLYLNATRKVKRHICDVCYSGLQKIAMTTTEVE